MRAGQNPDSFVMLKGNLYKEALITYMFAKEKNRVNNRNKNKRIN